MTTRMQLIIATSIAVLVGSVTIVGLSVAERREHRGRHGGSFHGERLRHGGPRHGERLLENFDRNNDGKLTQAEIDQTRSDRFTQFDTDKDGTLTLQEYQALWFDAMRSRMVDRFQSLDDDGDAVVTNEEFLAPFGKVVNRRDRDDNGELTRDELRRH